MKLLFYVYRFIGTTLFWIFFGLIGLVYGFVILPLVYLVVRNQESRQVIARNLIRGAFVVFVWVARNMRLIRCDVSGMEHWDAGASQLLLANHLTLIDVVILLSLFPQIDCVVKAAVTRNPVLRVSAGTANYISNRAPDELLDFCVERLKSGSSLLLFPQGTRAIRGEPLKFKLGAAEIALRAHATIVPIVIDCNPQMLAKNVPWYRIPPSQPRFRIKLLPPVPVAELVSGDVEPRRARHRVNESLVSMFEAELA
ncbi:MAG: 1-acyl-sn-glycerol-3-phosphate acyltransferase [Woeseiaceae bacterium]|nr:1-acyl-sn-glycerol-3-phosphate acyltransferase [Woeseiaceae bacterium]NIP20844.1 1-acyl-sn-glycerol-3-phosphate acyltransferase [Woeseiaceae bacterium]NIS89637.1 1-acyl-sn-glycerol-3-phosphate acyltransferase [Woeseiaceae bacterium]